MTTKDIRAAIKEYILGDSSIAAIIGTRIYPVILPQGVVDTSIVYSRISGLGDNTMRSATFLSRPRMQIDAWSARHDTAAELANLIKQRIDGFGPGDLPYGSNSPRDFVFVQGIFYQSERDDFDNEMKMFSVSRDYFVWHEEL